MSAVLDFLHQISDTGLPVLIATLVVGFYFFGKRIIDDQLLLRNLHFTHVLDQKDEPQFTAHLKHLIQRDDTSLRVLEEVFTAGRSHKSYSILNLDIHRISTLRQIQEALRQTIKDALQDDAFPTVRDHAIKLIDEAQKEIDALLQRKPFEGLQEPERSLLVDILADLPADKPVPKQKAVQLADIIKLKHQDILNLQAENAKSAAWTRWGTYGTVFFGILSIFLSIYTTSK
jgi:hypothetical protein